MVSTEQKKFVFITNLLRRRLFLPHFGAFESGNAISGAGIACFCHSLVPSLRTVYPNIKSFVRSLFSYVPASLVTVWMSGAVVQILKDLTKVCSLGKPQATIILHPGEFKLKLGCLGEESEGNKKRPIKKSKQSRWRAWELGLRTPRHFTN